MAVSAHAVLAALRARRPGLGQKKAQKLLYYCQGHHLATFGRPLFTERISAWDMGPVVGAVWYAEKNEQVSEVPPLDDEGALNTVGYVLSRYGALSGDELERLTHTEAPWQRADDGRQAGGSEPIRQEWIAEYFAADSGPDDDEVVLDPRAVQDLVCGAEERRAVSGPEDDPEAIRARIAELRSRNGPRAG